ncbi:DUF4124 domain-containing protein [Pseudomonas zhanjiangensis]|uniref:DUF4124 domain-containing protein n=1 Tax=Pseudomonas zhanjiangensis TaxID=3239015 RepID=A0ABV3YXT5_9PSED
MRRLLSCLLLCLALPAGAQIYKYTDANGNTVFTNQPPQGVPTENIELAPTNSVQMQAPSTPPQPSTNSEQATPYRTLQLSGVPEDGAVRANAGDFSVAVQLDPPLSPSHRLRLLLDGQPYDQPSTSTLRQLENIARGEHSLAVEVLSGGKSVQQSEAITFTVQRISLNSPARSAP